LLKWVRSLFGRASAGDASIADLEREAQVLRLELAERDRRVAEFETTLVRQRSQASALSDQTVQAEMERLFTDIATPMAQLLTQAHLLEAEDRPVQAGDVLAVAGRLIRSMQDCGLAFEGSIGDTVPFDPDHHEPLSASVVLRPGAPVIVRFVGVAYRGKLLRKAGVEVAEG
jgi:hypothetical protein